MWQAFGEVVAGAEEETGELAEGEFGGHAGHMDGDDGVRGGRAGGLNFRGRE